MEEVRPFQTNNKAPLFSFFVFRGKASSNRPPSRFAFANRGRCRPIHVEPRRHPLCALASLSVPVVVLLPTAFLCLSVPFAQGFSVRSYPVPLDFFLLLTARDKEGADTSSGCEQVAAGTCRVRMVDLPVD